MTLFPLLEQLPAYTSSQRQQPSDYLSLLLATYDASAKAEIRNTSLPYWSTFMAIGKRWVALRASYYNENRDDIAHHLALI